MNQEPKACIPGAIFMIGMMASGKSTIGKHLAARLGWEFVDSDKAIEEACGVPISMIFEKEGEAGFRTRETIKVAELTSRPGVIVAMGGGVPMFEENRKLLKRGLVVQLQTTVSDVIERTRFDKTRPLLQAEDPIARVRSIMLERGPTYEAVADVKISTSRTNPHAVVEKLLDMPEVARVVAEGNRLRALNLKDEE